MVQLDYDEELGLLHGMYGSMEAEFEVQRTTKRAELTAFLGLSRCTLTARELLMDYGKTRKSVSSQEWEMPLYGSKFGKNYMVWQKEASWWKWNM